MTLYNPGSYRNRLLASALLILLCPALVNAQPFSNAYSAGDSQFAYSDSAANTQHRTFLHRAAPYALLVAGGGLLFPLDRDVNCQFYKGSMRGQAADDFSLFIRQFGMSGPYLISIPLLAGHGLIFKNEKSYFVAGELAGGLLVGTAVTLGVKKAFGRERPYQTDSPFRFFKGGSSFYSGHSITAWTFATVISKNYPRQNLGFLGIRGEAPIIPVLMYSAASLVCVQRLYSHNHWASDVYYGALAGYVTGSAAVYLGNKFRRDHLRIGFAQPGFIRVCFGFN